MWHLIKVRREHKKIWTGYMNFKRQLKEKGIDITDADPNNTLVYKRDDEYHFAQRQSKIKAGTQRKNQ